MTQALHPRAAQLVAELGLQPHPEGGYYREIHRSPIEVQPLDGRPHRSALTSIYFLLAAGGSSAWHRVLSDEIWHHHEGDPLELFSAHPGFARVERKILGPFGEDSRPIQIVPAHHWQAARCLGDYTLIGCSVGPGFDFADFALLRDHPGDAAELRRHHPTLAPLL